MVENSLTLNVNELLQRGILARGSRTRGVINWLNAAGEVVASISYEADLTNPTDGRLRLRFSLPALHGGDRRQVDQRVALVTTRPGFGGARWWFVDDGRRVAQLHLTPNGCHFISRRQCLERALDNAP